MSILSILGSILGVINSTMSVDTVSRSKISQQSELFPIALFERCSKKGDATKMSRTGHNIRFSACRGEENNRTWNKITATKSFRIKGVLSYY